MKQKPKAIFFDVGNTLLFPSWDIILQPLGQPDDGRMPSILSEAEKSAKLELDRNMSERGTVDQSYWSNVFQLVLDRLGISSVDLHSKLIALARKSLNWSVVAPDAISVLEILKRDYRLGVISNADGTVDEQLRRSRLSSYFELIVDSGRCGFEKPDARIFEHAAQSLSLTTSDCLYIGDVYSIDYLGAQRAGMQSILCDAAAIYSDTNHTRAGSLTEILTLL